MKARPEQHPTALLEPDGFLQGRGRRGSGSAGHGPPRHDVAGFSAGDSRRGSGRHLFHAELLFCIPCSFLVCAVKMIPMFLVGSHPRLGWRGNSQFQQNQVFPGLGTVQREGDLKLQGTLDGSCVTPDI